MSDMFGEGESVSYSPGMSTLSLSLYLGGSPNNSGDLRCAGEKVETLLLPAVSHRTLAAPAECCKIVCNMHDWFS